MFVYRLSPPLPLPFPRYFFPQTEGLFTGFVTGRRKLSTILDNTNGKNIIVILIKAAFKTKKKYAETMAFINLTKKEDYHFLS